MKPVNFAFARAASLGEAAAILRDANGDAKAVAGGQSLGPMLNLRLVQPQLLLDITGIPELTHVEEGTDAITIGACVTTADIEDGRVAKGLSILAKVAAGVAYRAVRNRGTIGGSICHADPAGDWLPVLCALGAECIVTDGRATRRVPVAQFITGAFEVALAPGEILQSLRIPRPSHGARCGYYKVCRKAGEFALASAAVMIDPNRDRCRAVIGATQGRPIVIEDASAIFGSKPAHAAQSHIRVDETAIAALLAGPGLTTPASVRLRITALTRAAAQAVAP